MKGPLYLKSLRKAYADDLTIITARVQTNQLVLNSVIAWLRWSITMKAKPTKCRALAAKFFTSKQDRLRCEPHNRTLYSTFDPSLTLDSKLVPAIGPLTMELEDKFKFLGWFFRYDLKDGPRRTLLERTS